MSACAGRAATCTAAQTLVLCYNEITRLEGLEALLQLRTLDVAHNSLRKVRHSQGPRGVGPTLGGALATP